MPSLTPQASGERAVLAAYALHQYSQVRASVPGLSDEQMHQAASASVFTPALMLQHLTEVTEDWGEVLAAAPGRPGRAPTPGTPTSSGSPSTAKAPTSSTPAPTAN